MKNLICKIVLTSFCLAFILVTMLSCENKIESNKSASLKMNEKEQVKKNEVRKPAWAGQFYLSNKEELKSMINKYLEDAKPSDVKGELIGIVVPHAGYEYSGPVAAYSYKNLVKDKIDTIIMIGPAHHAYLEGLTIDNKDYETPLGIVKYDKTIRDKLCTKLGGNCYVEEPLAKEHSLEVQLPFIQTLLPDASIVPVLTNNPDKVEPLAKAIADIKKENDKVFFLASSDFSHFFDYDTAVKLDKKTIDNILSMDEKKLLADYNKRSESPCGCVAIATVIVASKLCGANKAVLYKYANSGDTTGDKSRVVGYSAIGFYKTINEGKEKEMTSGDKLSRNQQIELLKLARNSMETYVKTSKGIEVNIDDPALNAPLGAFVTLKESDELRGCIGRFGPTDSLAKTVTSMAVEAAVHDYRFPQVRVNELDKIDIEISVLSPLVECKDVNKIEVGVHGLEIRKGMFKGVLLPQVATEWGWDRETFLEHLCLKANLNKNAWKEGAAIFTFTAQVFGEKELNLK
ncbi:AmmeMemoRadiSam system protein B [bacterium]|nr:AmmeMemoRadiSam system protein B [bacterium]